MIGVEAARLLGISDRGTRVKRLIGAPRKLCAKAKRQQQCFICAKAKRQQQCFICAKAKRQQQQMFSVAKA
ncbi:hypothetical protein AN161_20675 [Lysinibacillus sp. FJAT-14222]|nr:hypothetical protein AN161_20675 [Lysinibacillus sp. FJAT-14222]